MAKKRRAIKKVKSKTWYEVHAPEIFNKENVVGHTLSSDPEKLLGRTLEIKLSQLVGDRGKSNQKLKLKIIEVKGADAYTEIVKYDLSRIYLARLIRRRTSKVEVITDLKTKDGKMARIKALAITRGRAAESQRKLIRKKLTEYLENFVKENTFDSLILATISNKIQKEVYKILKKIFPINVVEIRTIELKKEKKTTGTAKGIEE